MLAGGSSAVGLSAISTYLACPEQQRLQRLGVRRKRREELLDDYLDISEDDLAFGTLIHTLRAIRLVYGQQWALYWLEKINIDEASRTRASLIWKVYDNLYPLGGDPFDYLGVEVEVRTEIPDGKGGVVLRSVRYDSVIRAKSDGAIFSFEAKTSSRSGATALNAYNLQSYTHAALWNANAFLVAKYGRMQGTIYDLIVKTEVPKCERIGPKYTSKLAQQRALEYLALPERLAFPVGKDGSMPRFMHTCWGRWRPCPFIGGCHDGAWGDYEQINRATGEVRPIVP